MSERFELEPLAPELQRLLDAERSAPPPPRDLQDQLLSRLEKSLFDGGGGGSGPDGDPAELSGGTGAPELTAVATKVVAGTAASTAASTLTVAKIAVGVGVASFAAGGAVGAGIHAAVTEPPPAKEIVVYREVPVEPATPVIAEPAVVTEEPVAPVARPVRRRPEPKPIPAELSAPPAPADTSQADALREERSLVEQSRSALARGDAAAALAVLAEHRTQFREGRLAEERDALEIQALVATGRSEMAAERAEAFKKAYPSSLLRPAIDALVP